MGKLKTVSNPTTVHLQTRFPVAPCSGDLGAARRGAPSRPCWHGTACRRIDCSHTTPDAAERKAASPNPCLAKQGRKTANLGVASSQAAPNIGTGTASDPHLLPTPGCRRQEPAARRRVRHAPPWSPSQLGQRGGSSPEGFSNRAWLQINTDTQAPAPGVAATTGRAGSGLPLDEHGDTERRKHSETASSSFHRLAATNSAHLQSQKTP